MSLLNSRVIFGDNAVLKDISVAMCNFLTGSSVLPLVATEDFLYLGSELPFNHRWFEVDVVNDQAAKIKIETWDFDEWTEAVDVVDQTSVNGVSLAKSGIISFTLDKDELWAQEDTQDTGDKEEIIGLGTVKIFDMYWARISWDNNFNVLTSLKFIGQKFSEEEDLQIIYPDLVLPQAKTQFEAGKTDWKAQEFLAALEIVKTLKSNKIIKSKNQILNWGLFKDASVHKIASMIFRAYGADFRDERKDANADYKKALDLEIFQLDSNRNARIDDGERFKPTGLFFR